MRCGADGGCTLRFVGRDEHQVDCRRRDAGPEGEVDASELRASCRRGTRLNEKHRAVVVLRMFQDCSTRETARHARCSRGDGAVAMSRA